MKNKAWIVTLIVFLAGVTFAAGNFKVPPTMVTVLAEMNTGVSMGGWLMSMGALAGIILALPAGSIMSKTGPKKLGIFSLFCALIGNVIGALAPNFTILLLGRLVEGIGFGLIGVVAPAIIAVWFPPEKRGLPMAIWSIWIGVGMLFIFNITNVVMPIFGWRGDWWLMAILTALAIVMFALGVQVPSSKESTKQEEAESPTVSMATEFKSPAPWLLGIIFGVFAFGCGALTTFVPTFLIEEVGMDLATANQTSSVVTIGMIIGGIVIGIVLNIVKNRNTLLVVSMILTASFMYLTFKVTTPVMILPFMFIIGFVYQLIPAIVFTVTPEAASSPATMGVAMGIVIFAQNLSNFLAPVVIGAIVENNDGVWDSATMLLVIVGIVGVIAAILYTMVMKKRASSSFERTVA